MIAPLVYAIYIGTTFIIVFLLAIGLRLIARRQKRLGQQVFRLQIANQGNMNCHYALMAQEPAGVLRFAMLLNGVALPAYVPPPPLAQPSAQPAVLSAPAQPARAAPRRGAAASTGRKGAKKKKGSQVNKTGGKIAGILMSLGSLLPGRSGRGISRAGSQVRQAQIKTDQANRLSSNVGSLAESGEPTPQEAPPPSHTRAGTPTPSASSPAAQAQPAPTPGASAIPAWVQTPYITPGETLLIDLVVTPTRPRQSQMYSFKVLSRCIEKSETPSQSSDEIEFGTLQAKGISWLGAYWQHLLWVAVVIGLAVLSFYYLSSLVPLASLG